MSSHHRKSRSRADKKARQYAALQEQRSPKAPVAPERPQTSPSSGGFDRNRLRPSHLPPPRPFPTESSGASRGNRIKATVDKHNKGFAFLIPDNPKEEHLFVPENVADTLLHKDRVEVHLSPQGGRIIDIKVIGHRFRELVGRYHSHPFKKKMGLVVYERGNAREEVEVTEPTDKALLPRRDDYVRVKMIYPENGSVGIRGEIIRVYGQNIPANADIECIAGEFNLVEHHSAACKAEAAKFKFEIPEGYDDFRHVPFVTIDPETARDFDDAIHVEKDGQGGYWLWVAIADVSHYVREGSIIDKEAFERATSVYFPERAFHMLPRELSENLCSLRPNEDRLAMTAKMHYNAQGERLSTEIFNSVILSKRRASYLEIHEEEKQHGKDPNWQFAPHFALSHLIRKKRVERGSIDFDLPEAKVQVDEVGEPTAIHIYERFDVHRLIEDFMIAANEAVTEWAVERRLPFVYRIHEEPSIEAIGRFQKMAASVGYPVKILGTPTPKVFQNLVNQFEKHPAHYLLNMALLRSMRQAVYSAEHKIHFGLASKAYTHFTSPIRRYPDLLVHRLLKHYLKVNRQVDRQWITEMEEHLGSMVERCSQRERLAAEADREAVRIKQVRLMQHHLGEEYAGLMMGATKNGFFVQIEEPYIEGFVPLDSLTDDHYQYNEEKLLFVGRRTRRMFKIGMPLKIQVVSADLESRRVTFGVLEGGGKAAHGDTVDTSKRPGKNFEKKNSGKERKQRHQKKSGNWKKSRKSRK